MTCIIRNFSEDGYLLITHGDNEESFSLKNNITQTIQAMIENNCYKVLADYSNSSLETGIFTMLDFHQFSNESLEKHNISPLLIKQAFVLNKEQAAYKDFLFFETLCVNRGQKVKIFEARDEAVSWLIK